MATLAVAVAVAFAGAPVLAEPVATTSANIVNQVKRALGLSKTANKRSIIANKRSIRANKRSIIAVRRAGRPGPQGPRGEPGPKGPQGEPGSAAWSADCNEGLAANDVMVRVGSACVDKYEASIWDAPSGGSQITGAIPCDADGSDCDNIYARSVPGVIPRSDITWFQAQQALANSGKRLPTNAEWQMAVAGTPDHPGPCNTDSSGVQPTGASAGCVSRFGANDMVGNFWEWVADWVPRSSGGGTWSFSDDFQVLTGAATSGEPGALMRGGDFDDSTGAGPFAITGDRRPSFILSYLGFRGAR